jgi:hypothetical protein
MNLRETFRSNDRERGVGLRRFPIYQIVGFLVFSDLQIVGFWFWRFSDLQIVGFRLCCWGFWVFPIRSIVREIDDGFSDQIDRGRRSSAAARSRERRALIPCQIFRFNRCNLLRSRVPCYIGWKNPSRGVYMRYGLGRCTTPYPGPYRYYMI